MEFVYMVFLLYTWHNNHFVHDLAFTFTFKSVALVLLLFFIAPTGYNLLLLLLCWYCMSCTNITVQYVMVFSLFLCYCVFDVFSKRTCSIGFGECEHSCVDLLCSIVHQPWFVLQWELSGM
jgi:hypothetical protein